MNEGSLVALVTPFRNDEIDEDALRNMVRYGRPALIFLRPFALIQSP